ncbi:MAG: hypothetical protein FADNKDHG_01346 [Holosporales bacterium]
MNNISFFNKLKYLLTIVFLFGSYSFSSNNEFFLEFCDQNKKPVRIEYYHIRHTDQGWSYADAYTGVQNNGLTEKGKVQAQNTGKYVSESLLHSSEPGDITIFVSSPLERARETREIVLKSLTNNFEKIVFSSSLYEDGKTLIERVINMNKQDRDAYADEHIQLLKEILSNESAQRFTNEGKLLLVGESDLKVEIYRGDNSVVPLSFKEKIVQSRFSQMFEQLQSLKENDAEQYNSQITSLFIDVDSGKNKEVPPLTKEEFEEKNKLIGTESDDSFKNRVRDSIHVDLSMIGTIINNLTNVSRIRFFSVSHQNHISSVLETVCGQSKKVGFGGVVKIERDPQLSANLSTVLFSN